MTGTGPGGKLRGRRIAVTRPAGQNERLAELIRAEGGEPIVFPALEILDPADVGPLAAAADRLDAYDLAVFVSPSAVEKSMPVIRARREWPAGLRAATVGRGSEQALRRYGVAEVIVPRERFDSEALLDCRELAEVTGRRIVIFRGDGGRELLGDTLRQRGATVDYVECYRRVRPNADVSPLLRAWDRGELDAVTISSSAGLHNLFDMLGPPGQQRLKRTVLFAPHARIAANARSLGCQRVIETAPGDEGIAAALAAFWEKM
jgi:uroporphyrinogen-III synthase